MILRKGIGSTKLKRPIGQFLNATLVEQGRPYIAVMCVPFDQLLKMHKDKPTKGIPVYMAIDNETLAVYPTPERSFRMVLRYFPPVEEQ